MPKRRMAGEVPRGYENALELTEAQQTALDRFAAVGGFRRWLRATRERDRLLRRAQDLGSELVKLEPLVVQELQSRVDRRVSGLNDVVVEFDRVLAIDVDL